MPKTKNVGAAASEVNEIAGLSDIPADGLAFLTFEDLRKRRIVGSRAQMHRLQKDEKFPFPLPIRTGGRALFIPSQIRAWFLSRGVNLESPVPAGSERQV